MKSMTAAEAKNSFGKLLDTAQREPVLITKKNRPVGVMMSIEDLSSLTESEGAEAGVSSLELLLERNRIRKRLAQAREDVAAGRVEEMDEAFFEELRRRAAGK
jgi:prevent-host-death family protein